MQTYLFTDMRSGQIADAATAFNRIKLTLDSMAQTSVDISLCNDNGYAHRPAASESIIDRFETQRAQLKKDLSELGALQRWVEDDAAHPARTMLWTLTQRIVNRIEAVNDMPAATTIVDAAECAADATRKLSALLSRG